MCSEDQCSWCAALHCAACSHISSLVLSFIFSSLVFRLVFRVVFRISSPLPSLSLSFSVLFLSLSPSLSPCVVVVVVVVSCMYVVVVVVCACGVVWHAENSRVYIENVPVCTSTTPACGNTCARGAVTHGDVFNVHTVRSVGVCGALSCCALCVVSCVVLWCVCGVACVTR